MQMGSRSLGKGGTMVACIILMLAFETPLASAGIVEPPRPVSAGIMCEETVYNANLVRAVQRKLREARAKNVTVDGKWSDRTINALENYQKMHKITPSRELDEITFRAMFGSEQPYRSISEIVKNPHHAPEDIYQEFCGN
jgi:peptidoglycan hydrolase-like protein with peptidoglycan-binding domain